MKSRRSKQSSQYDKILKENLEASLPGLIANVLHIDVAASEELPDDLQHTRERKPDALKRITDQSGQSFILHIEFQLANEPKMVHRMHNYCAMLMEQYELPVRQYVFYLGPTAVRMATSLATPDLSFRYSLVSFQELDYQLFLASDKPEEILLAILANFQPQESSAVLKRLLEKLDETATGPLVFQKYIAQLRVLVQLRSIQPLLETVMDNLTKYVNEQGDPFYVKGKNMGFALGIEAGKREGIEAGKQLGMEAGKQLGMEAGKQLGMEAGKQLGMEAGKQLGMEAGKREGIREATQNLIVATDFSDERIAALVSESIDFVREIRRQVTHS